MYAIVLCCIFLTIINQSKALSHLNIGIESNNSSAIENSFSYLNNIALNEKFEHCSEEITATLVGSDLKLGNEYYRLLKTNQNIYALWNLRFFEVLYITETAQNSIISFDRLKIKTPIPIARKNTKNEKLLEAKKDFLIVLTTCNQLKMTILAIDYIKECLTEADLIVVDDHSTDGTVDYLIKRGYTVHTKESARGLTDSWNIGYQYGNALSYKYVMFTNNDVLFSLNTLRVMREDLYDEVLVGPLTTPKGAGHNPSQSILKAYNLSDRLSDYVYNYRNFETIQSALIAIRKDPNRYPPSIYQKLTSSLFNGQIRFNGFFFATNLKKIQPAAFQHPNLLFDSSNIMVGQEDALVKKMITLGLTPKISNHAFTYHFKSVTVAVAGGISAGLDRTRRDPREDLSFYHPELRNKKAGSRYLSDELPSNQSFDETFIGPELIEAFHNDETKSNSEQLPQEMNRILNNKPLLSALMESKAYPSEYRLNAITFPFLYSFYNSSFSKIESDISIYPTMGDPLLFHYKPTSPLSSSLFIPQYQQQNRLVSEAILRNEFVFQNGSIYIDNERVQDNPILLHNVKETFRAANFRSKIVMAFAISDPIKNPAAGDVFTAQELAEALERDFNVEVRYLYKGRQWYNPHFLYDVDILIAFLDDYDISRIYAIERSQFHRTGYSVKSSVKSTLFTIAWMRNWFHRWLSRPWIGNYDLLLTSSRTAQDFFVQIINFVGLPIKCFMGCPSVRYPPLTLPPSYAKKDRKGGVGSGLADVPLHLPLKDVHFISTRRMQVPVELLQIATDNYAFRADQDTPPVRRRLSQRRAVSEASKVNLSEFNADYVFTGSYFNVYRKIMDFDPREVPQWKGAIIGEGWDNANVSNAWKRIAIGRIAYEDIPQIYRKVKIVIDDSNHVTEPWGSVNSRVFDAVASGCLVISNGRLGVYSLFAAEDMVNAMQPNEIPVFSTGAELAKLINFYLSHPVEREKTIKRMRDIVLKQHTYTNRASELVQHLTKLSIHVHRKLLFEPSEVKAILPAADSIGRQNSNTHPATSGNRHAAASFEETSRAGSLVGKESVAHAANRTLGKFSSICIGIRTMEAQSDSLYLLVKSFLQMYRQSAFQNWIDFKIFIVDTEFTTDTFHSYLVDLTDHMNQIIQKRVVFYVHELSKEMQFKEHKNPFYGYDATDFVLSYMLYLHQYTSESLVSIERNRANSLERRRNLNIHTTPQDDTLYPTICDWILFTNGDNMYNSAWLDAIGPFLFNRKLDIIGWDFISHHLRNGIANQLISIELKRKFVDLGSVVMRSDLYLKSSAEFMSESLFTKDLFARDFHMLEHMLGFTNTNRTHLLHRCLLFHQ